MRRRARRAQRAQARASRRRPPASDGGANLLATRWGRLLCAAVGGLAVATVVGLLLLWPPSQHGGTSEAFGGPTTAASVTAARDVRCPGPVAQRCRRLTARLDEGADSGRTAQLDLGPVNLVSTYAPGDSIRVHAAPAAPGAAAGPAYQLAGPDRRGTLVWLIAGFALLVVLLARWRGLLALVGFAASLALVVKFLVPAMLAGSAPLLVAVVGALAVMFITVGLTYGVSVQSAAAVLGIAASLLFAGIAGAIAVDSAKLDGRSSELASYLEQSHGGLSLQGVVLAGVVLGALGVIADMAVTQASAVMALRRTDPRLDARRLFTRAFGVGRDHLVATTHTLVLVYVAATLPLLLVLQSASVGFTDAVNFEDVAGPIVATLIGAIALLLSVPLTTAVAALLVSHASPGDLPAGHHGHEH
ncbi:MAG: hypothetical protein QOG63_1421 [Thermoleophilaceae bacterium]|nr:hypothetical protein [Thermoleophilaceae bacterium]